MPIIPSRPYHWKNKGKWQVKFWLETASGEPVGEPLILSGFADHDACVVRVKQRLKAGSFPRPGLRQRYVALDPEGNEHYIDVRKTQT